MSEQDRQHAAAPADPVAPVPPPRPVPDLGFFAGAPQPRGGGAVFGGPAPGGQLGSFGATAAPPSPFGRAPAPTLGRPFGQPATSFGAPATPLLPAPPPAARPGPHGPLATLRATPGGRWALRVTVGLAVAAVLGMLGVGRFAFLDLFDKEVSAPSSLAGLPRVEQATVDLLDQQVSAYGDAIGVDLEVAAYGDALAPVLFLGATYDDETPEPAEVAGVLGAGGGSNTQLLGENTCTEIEGGAVVMCLRVDDGAMIAIVSPARPMQDVSAITDEAWGAQ